MLSIVCTTADGEYTLTECLDFRFEKERYTPYTYFEGKWHATIGDMSEVVRIEVYKDSVLIHRGTPDGVEMTNLNGRYILSVKSRGYTNALTKNRPASGLQSNVNLLSIGNSSIVCPFVDYEPNTPTVGLINYYETTSIWDAIVCYTQQAIGNYPYVKGVNMVMASKPTNPTVLEIYPGNLITRSYGSDYSKAISAIMMSDAEGNPGAYSLAEPALMERNIARLVSLPLDQEWLMNPQAGIYSRIAYSMRSYRYESFKVMGWADVDLLDKLHLTYDTVQKEISRITVTGGSGKPIMTELCCYHDAFCV